MNKERLILGENCIYSADSNETQLNNNILVCGGSGSGKTMSICQPLLLETTNSSVIVTVSKRRIIKEHAPLFRIRGYRVLDLNFANPSASDCSYDPLAYVKSFSDIKFLANSVMSSGEKTENKNIDPYWREAAVSLLSAEIGYTLMTAENPRFSDVLDLHHSLVISEGSGTVETSLDEKFYLLESKDHSCFAMSVISNWLSFKNLPIRTAGCVFGTLNTVLDEVFPPDVYEMIKTKETVDFSEIGTKKTALFVTNSAVNPSLNRFINIFYAQAIKQLFEFAESTLEGKLPVPVRFICDDFAVGGKIHNFPEYISIFREKGISAVLLLQSESQLEAMYGNRGSVAIINNCDSYIFMGGMDLETAKNISQRVNQPLEDVLYLPCGMEYIMRRGQRPILTSRYNIMQDKLYKKALLLSAGKDYSHEK